MIDDHDQRNSTATPQRLYLMQLSTTIIPLAAGQTLAMSSGCYLVQTSDEKNILIDSGLPADYTPPPGTPPAEHEKNVLEHLADLDLHPDDIDLLICTHFDVDHAGYHDAFTKAELVVQRQHYELARSGHARFAAARTHWDQDIHLGISRFWCACRGQGRCCWRSMPSSSSACLPLIVGPGLPMTTRSNCAPARANSWSWSSVSTWHWSSLAMMDSSGKRSRKRQPITSDEKP